MNLILVDWKVNCKFANLRSSGFFVSFSFRLQRLHVCEWDGFGPFIFYFLIWKLGYKSQYFYAFYLFYPIFWPLAKSFIHCVFFMKHLGLFIHCMSLTNSHLDLQPAHTTALVAIWGGRLCHMFPHGNSPSGWFLH